MELLIIILILLGLWIWHKLFKIPKVNNLVMITGGVKSGKSTFGVYLTIKQWKRNHRRWKIRKWIRKLFKINKYEEEPLLYSNIPLNCNYVEVTEELLTRKKRFNYGSCIYIGEVSLVSNSMNYKNQQLNDEQLLFYKLIAHETKGGLVVLDTQCIQDTHYAIKRSISEYFYIHHTIKIPFFIIQYIREDRYSEDGTVISQYNEDTEESLKRVIVPKSVWKKFDCYCYSVLTDDLEKDNEIIEGKKLKDLKARKIVSFNRRIQNDRNNNINY